VLDLLLIILIGLIAGWLAGRILKERSQGLIGNLIIGVVGAIIGGYIFEIIGIPLQGYFGTLISAIVGAVILLAIIQYFKKA